MAGWFNDSEIEGRRNGTGWNEGPMTAKLMEYDKRYKRKYGRNSIDQIWGKREKVLTFESRSGTFFRCKARKE